MLLARSVVLHLLRQLYLYHGLMHLHLTQHLSQAAPSPSCPMSSLCSDTMHDQPLSDHERRTASMSSGAGDMQAALTVVLVNNGGGGIFSFLPIADTLPPDIFTPLWATPQNVDLAGNQSADGVCTMIAYRVTMHTQTEAAMTSGCYVTCAVHDLDLPHTSCCNRCWSSRCSVTG